MQDDASHNECKLRLLCAPCWGSALKGGRHRHAIRARTPKTHSGTPGTLAAHTRGMHSGHSVPGPREHIRGHTLVAYPRGVRYGPTLGARAPGTHSESTLR